MSIFPSASGMNRFPALESGSGESLDPVWVESTTEVTNSSTQSLWDSDEFDRAPIKTNIERDGNGDLRIKTTNNTWDYSSDPFASGGSLTESDATNHPWTYDGTNNLVSQSPSNGGASNDGLALLDNRQNKQRLNEYIRLRGSRCGITGGNKLGNSNPHVKFNHAPDSDTFQIVTNDGTSNTVRASDTVTISSSTYYWAHIKDTGSKFVMELYQDDAGSIGSQIGTTISWSYASGGTYDTSRKWGFDVVNVSAAVTMEVTERRDRLNPESASLTGTSKEFGSVGQPNIDQLTYSLNGGSIDLTITGSPGTSAEETNTLSLGGASSYSLTWTNNHATYRVDVDMSRADGGDPSPDFSSGRLYI